MKIAAVLALGIALQASTAAAGTIVFSDNFNRGANAAWGNESGKWRALKGTYDASVPGNGQTHPVTYTDITTKPALTNFTTFVTVEDLNDGGVWLRSSYNGGKINGVLLVTGGQLGTYNGFYWHVVQNGVFSPEMNFASLPGAQGSTQRLRIVVRGNTYSLYVGGAKTPITSITTSAFSSGSTGLYDFSPNSGASTPRGQVFDNFAVSVP